MRGLTALKVANARPHPNKRVELPDRLRPGLFLVIQPSGYKSWCVRYRRLSDRKPRKLVLPGGLVSLATARKLAQQALDQVAEGGDPAADKQIEKRAAHDRESEGFADTVALFLKRDQSSNRTWRQTAYLLGLKAGKDGELEIIPDGLVDIWGKRRIGEITRREIIDRLDDIVDGGSGYMANRTLSAVRRFFAWCVEKDRLTASPCVGIVPPAEETSRTRVLNDTEIKLFWDACDKLQYPYGAIGKLLLLTGQRRGEVAGMRRSEIADGFWTIPASRTKNKQEHKVPLSRHVAAVLGEVPHIAGDLVFTVTGKAPVRGWSKVKRRLDGFMLMNAQCEVPHWKVHDLRRTAASGMQRLGVRLEVIERALNHTSGLFHSVVGTYQRDPMTNDVRAALEAWGDEVARIVSGKPADVVQLRRA